MAFCEGWRQNSLTLETAEQISLTTKHIILNCHQPDTQIKSRMGTFESS
jgi:hypothetical protein